MARAPHAISKDPTPYAVICDGDAWGYSCGKTYLTQEAYDWSMARPDMRWKCPVCGGNAWFDDDELEDYYEKQTAK